MYHSRVDKVYATINFMCIGIVELCSTRKQRELHFNEKFLPTVGFDPDTSCLLDSHVMHCANKPLEV